MNSHYLWSYSDPLSVPSLMVSRVTNSAVEYRVRRNDDITNALITGYEVIRFGVPMIGEYVNAGRGRRVTISPAVPGAQYRITAWALLGDYNGRRSVRAAVGYAVPASELIHITVQSIIANTKVYFSFCLMQIINLHKKIKDITDGRHSYYIRSRQVRSLIIRITYLEYCIYT